MTSIDRSQEEVISSQERRIFVEAPAGYGKTTVMVKKLIADMESDMIPYPKRALALTFSVNAARKMKNDIREALNRKNHQAGASKDRVDVFNYHALSRKIILKHGSHLLGSPIDVNTLTPLNESHVLSHLNENKISLSTEDNFVLNSFSRTVKQADSKSAGELIDQYCDLVIAKLIPNGCITYNAILALAIKLIDKNQNVRNLYRSLYPYVIVDEAQDTNILGYKLLTSLADEQTRICMFGDSLQRIYGFIGAIPNFIEQVKSDFDLKVMELEVNHRFLPGSSMQLLDKNIRENIRNPITPCIKNDSKVPLLFSGSIESEIDQTCKLAAGILRRQDNTKIAVLVRSRGSYSAGLLKEMKTEGIDCFNGLFQDEETDYIRFNEECLAELDRLAEQTHEVNFRVLDQFSENVKGLIKRKNFIYGDSYIQLIDGFCSQIKIEFASASPTAKYQYARSVFENRSLRHAIDYINADVVIMTMHSSKGLEWDYVFLPEMMQWVNPSYATCKNCCMELKVNDISNSACHRKGSHIPASYIDELCLFYVAVTRARRSTVFLATVDRINKNGEHRKGNLSCFAALPGIKVFTPSSFEDIVPPVVNSESVG